MINIARKALKKWLLFITKKIKMKEKRNKEIGTKTCQKRKIYNKKRTLKRYYKIKGQYKE